MNVQSDNALMLEVKAGNINKMALLFERYHKKLFGFIYHSTGKSDLSEDLVQNVFYRMLKYKDTYTGSGEFRAWMYQIARNVVLENVRKNKNSKNHYDVTDYQGKIGETNGADENILKDQEIKQLNLALNKLSAEKREILILCRLQELKYEEVGKILQISEGAVKVRVHRAMNDLKEIYQKMEDGYELP